jgi:hypothetical protein
VPHYVYARKACELRLVGDDSSHATEHYGDGMPIGNAVDRANRRYVPHFYIDSFALLRKHAVPLAADPKRAHPELSLKFRPTSLGRHRLTSQVCRRRVTHICNHTLAARPHIL